MRPAPLLCLALLALPAAGQEKVRFARRPCLSPDGQWIAFDFQGDVWRVEAGGGVARRLTIHSALDRAPRISPDGRWVAFESDRFGGIDVLVVAAGGGRPIRLTHHSDGDSLEGWLPDSSGVVFGSRREYSHLSNAVYSVALTGGTPRRLIDALGSQAAPAPDGRRVAYVRGSTRWWRRRYRGAANRDIWVADLETGTSTRWTSFEGTDHWPAWTPDGGLVFVSDRDGTPNLWRQDGPTAEAVQLTAFEGHAVRFPSISADGSRLAFARGLGVYTASADGSDVREVEILAAVGAPQNRFAVETHTGRATDLAVHPAGKALAFVAGGDIWVVDAEHGGTARPLSTGPAREGWPAWTADGKALVYATDAAGSLDLVRVESADPDETALWRTRRLRRVPIAATDADEFAPVLDPTGRHLAYVRGQGDLIVSDPWGDRPRVVVAGWNEPDAVFSPDGAWIAYAVEDAEFNSDVWLVPTAGGRPTNVSLHPDDDHSPSFAGDGSMLAWASHRHGDDHDILAVFLRAADALRTESEWEAIWREADDRKKSKEGAKEDDGPPVVVVDLERIHERARAVTSLHGDELQPVVSPDGRTIVFTSDRDGSTDLYRIRRDGKEMKVLTSGGLSPTDIAWSADGKTIWFLRTGGAIARVAATGGAVAGVAFEARQDVDREARRRQVWLEAHRLLGKRFYDPAHHGVDWKALDADYWPLAEAAGHRDDFDAAFELLMGELDASHLGIYGYRSPAGPATGHLGVRLEEPAEGDGFVVGSVLPDTPASRPDTRLEPGDRILAVDGRRLERGSNVYAALAGTVDVEVELEVAGPDGEERRVLIRPTTTAAVREALYREWLADRRRQVAALSGGRLGYVHIRAMNWPSLETFEQEIYSVGREAEGLLIDVRYNGGGWTTDYLLTMLSVRRHAYTIPRDGERGYPQGRLPFYAWPGPVAVLCNERSYSNAEIFSHAIKTLGRGPLVGKTTFGAVISTGAATLSDGTVLRIPFRGWYVNDGTGTNMERQGAVPDFEVENAPGEEPSGKDRQLERAVAVLLSRLEEDD